jgi:DNA-binding NtrC family response regulator
VRIRVLVVVNSESASPIQLALERAGFDVTLALSCAEARQCAWLGPFAIGVIDVELVDGSGIELADWLCRDAHICASVFRASDAWSESALEQASCSGPVVSQGDAPQQLVMAVGQLAQDVLKRQLTEVGDILRRHSARPPRGRCADAAQRGRISIRPSRPTSGNGNQAARKP